MRSLQQDGLSALALAIAALLAGCGTPGAPQPPSLNLPDRVADLAATRAGDRVSLTWTMPKKNTDKLLLKDDVTVHICRQEEHSPCAPGTDIHIAPGAAATFADSLPRSETEGAPRVLTYFVELKNRNGRSAGLSNGGVVIAGLAPAPVTGLTAEVRKAGIVLRWQPGKENEAVRLHRTLLTPPPAKTQQGLLAQEPEPVEQNLLVEAGADSGHVPDRALDKNIRFGETYAYRAQRVVRVVANGQTLELAGELSAPMRVEALDVFPPAVPTGLAAVAIAGENGGETAIDLSWQPDTEDDLAGYIVYRRQGDGTWQRISPAQPVVGPAFHDVQVQRGNTYRYAVTAIDQGGHESARSAEAEEGVPGP
jgi:hypothetical protein